MKIFYSETLLVTPYFSFPTPLVTPWQSFT